ncbi:MAG: glycerophosphodiester phosphodiesterase [Steroidobacteraceae bacterium]
MMGLGRRTRADFARRWRVVFAWQLLVQMLGVAALAPLAGWLLDRVVARSGSAVVSNYDIAAFALSPWGLLFVLLAVVAAVAFHMAQFAGYAWISGHAIGRRPVTLRGTVGAVWGRLWLLTRIGLRMVGRVLLLALPVLAVAGALWFATLRGHDVNYYLAERPPEWRRALLIVAVAGAVFAFLVLRQFARWVFTMPLAMFERRTTPREVLAASERMVEGTLLRTIAPLVLWWLLHGALAYALFWLGARVTEPALGWAGMDVQRVLPLVTLFLAVSAITGFVLSTLLFSGHQFLITRMYAERRDASLKLDLHTEVDAVRTGERRAVPVMVSLAVITVLAVGAGAFLLGRLDLRTDIAVTAHRGAKVRAPENTMAAFRAAYADGAQFIELDVQRTRDGQVIVLHDGDLMRMGGDPRRVAELALAEITAVDIGARTGPQHAGELVPSLEQVIDFARGKLRINIELKYNVPDPALAPAVVDLLRRQQFTDQVVITSLDHAALQQVRQIAPELRTGLIVTAAVGDVVGTDTDFVSLNMARADASLVQRARAAGKQVHVWTVNTPEAMMRMIERGVDNMITDDPATAVRLVRERNALSTGEKLALGLRVLFTKSPPELTDERAVPAL